MVTEELDGASLAAAVHSLFGVSWNKSRDWVRAGKVSLNGVGCSEVRQVVRSGDQLTLSMSARRPRSLLDTIEEAIVHVDSHVVVVNKPPGLSTVPYEGERDTLDRLVQLSLARLERRAAGNKSPSSTPSLGVVHRIDRETSGLLVFARTWMAKRHLALQFREHTVRRRYLAIAHGDVQPGTLRSHLLADRGDGRRGSRESGARGHARSSGEGRLAVTHLEVLERLRGATLVACRLETGRTHQIRIQLSEAGHPLLGESTYARGFTGQLLPAPRLMLHAAELGFVHPATGESVSWEQPMPEDMAEVLRALR